MIKYERLEEMLTMIEQRVGELWDIRDKGRPPVQKDLLVLGKGEDVCLLIEMFCGPSPKLGKCIVCAIMDTDDIADLHQRLYTLVKKIQQFPTFFTTSYCELPIWRCAETLYAWFVEWAHLPEVPKGLSAETSHDGFVAEMERLAREGPDDPPDEGF